MRPLLPVALVVLVAACADEPARVVSLTLPEDTHDSVGPYLVQAELRGALGDDELLVCWSSDGATFHAEPTAARAGRHDLRFAALPGQPAGTTVSFHVALVAAGADCPTVAATALHSFRVLATSLACEVDSDCRLGLEICADATCREFSGTCASSGPCPGGYTCDAAHDPPTCVIPPRACTSDSGCPALEACDLDRGACVARP